MDRVITASALNGPLVLRHELGHSLIPVGEEYEGGGSTCTCNYGLQAKIDFQASLTSGPTRTRWLMPMASSGRAS